jgi:hypothetical protein
MSVYSQHDLHRPCQANLPAGTILPNTGDAYSCSANILQVPLD